MHKNPEELDRLLVELFSEIRNVKDDGEKISGDTVESSGNRKSVWAELLERHRGVRGARERVMFRYREPVFNYILRQGFNEEDADTLTQEVFFRITSEAFLKKIGPSQRKFSALILAVTRRAVTSFRAHKLPERGDPSESLRSDGSSDMPVEAPPDAVFDLLWVKNLMSQALERMKNDDALKALRLQIDGRSYREIASEVGASETEIVNLVHRAKRRLRYEIESLIRDYSGADDVDEEISSLLRFL